MTTSEPRKPDEGEPEPHLSDERSPLLGTNVVAPTADPDAAEASVKDDTNDDKPLPMGQILLLCYARIVEPIAFFGIFPFVNQMVQINGNLDEAEVGFYSGLIESLFSLTQMILMIFWGQASDRVGRKPVLVVSMAGVTVMTAAFGFSKTIWQMILCRCLAGVFAGSIVTIRVMITELSTPKTQARAFSFFMVSSNLGLFVGPLIGGSLADPAGQYGGIFKKTKFFEQFPYALPTLVVGFVSLTATVVAALFIKETLPAKESSDNESHKGKSENESLSMWQLVKYPGVLTVLFLYTHVMLLAFSYTAVIPVFWFTSIERGGFGFAPSQISLFIAIAGISQALWTLLVFPPVHQRYGTGWLLRACSIGYVFFFWLNPLANTLLRHATTHDAQWEKTLFWVFGPLFNAVGAGVSIAFSGVQLALNDASPSPATLGSLNGLASSAASGVRAFSPALFTSIFAIGVKKNILGGHLIWVVLDILAVGFVIVARNLPARVEGRPKNDRDEQENSID